MLPLTETSNQTPAAATEVTTNGETKPRGPRQPRQRGPPEDGIPSKNKVMVANLPYDLSEEKVRSSTAKFVGYALNVSPAQGALCCI